MTVMDGDVAVGTVTADRNGSGFWFRNVTVGQSSCYISRRSRGQRLGLDVVQRSGTNAQRNAACGAGAAEGKDENDIAATKMAGSRLDNFSQLDVVDYDEAGRLRCWGRPIQAHTIVTSTMDIDGRKLPRMVNGSATALRWNRPYTLRVDERMFVVARIELLFRRCWDMTRTTSSCSRTLCGISRRLQAGTMFSVIYEGTRTNQMLT